MSLLHPCQAEVSYQPPTRTRWRCMSVCLHVRAVGSIQAALVESSLPVSNLQGLAPEGRQEAAAKKVISKISTQKNAEMDRMQVIMACPLVLGDDCC